MRKLTVVLTALAAFVPVNVLADVQDGDRVIECFCTDSAGSRVDLGEEICLFVDGRAFMARCEMSLNNPMWRETGQSCLSSGVSETLQSIEPGAEMPLAHPET